MINHAALTMRSDTPDYALPYIEESEKIVI